MDFIKKYWWMFLVILIFIPLILELGITFIPGNGSNDGWLGFWGGYLGATVTVLFSWYNTNYQINIERERQKIAEIEKLLPYINIDKNGIIVSSRSDLPFENFDYKLNNDKIKRLGHIFPNKESIKLKNEISKLYIRCSTVTGIKIFFCYDQGINGCTCYQYNNEWKWYSGVGSTKAEKIRESFMENY